MRHESLTVGVFQENAYLLIDDATRRAALIDPGAEPERLVELVRSSGAVLDAIWLTHGHVDHIGGIAGVRREWPVPVFMHAADHPLYARGADQARLYGVPFEQPDAPDEILSDGDELVLGSTRVSVLHLPGHSPGHVAFQAGGVLFGGDLLFAGSIGRTDLPLSNPADMELSLERVCTLDDETMVYPGHGPATTIGAERATNAFLNGMARVVRAR